MLKISLLQIPLLSFSRKFNFWKIKAIELWNGHPLILKVIWAVTAFFLLLFIVFLFLLILSRIYKNNINKKTERLKESLQESFSMYLFNESLENISLKEKNEDIIKLFGEDNLKRPFYRTILMKELMSLHINYSGEIAEKLKQLFLILGFDKEVQKKLRSRYWYIKANGINIVQQMNLEQFSSTVLQFVVDPNYILRSEAQVAYVNLNKRNPFVFFVELKYQISDWDQIKLHNALMLYENSEIPLMGKWLKSDNESIVVFSLKMIGFYNQQEEIDTIKKVIVLECLKENRSKNIKIQAIKTLGALGSKESSKALFEYLILEKRNRKIIIETLKSLASIGIFDDDVDKIVDFLYTNDYDLIFHSCLAIKSAPNGISILQNKGIEKTEFMDGIITYAFSLKN